MSAAFPPEKFLEEVERRHDAMRSNVRMEPRTVKAIKNTAAAIAAEYGRLEAMHDEGLDEVFIPHKEKARLYELAVDAAALCMVLCENTIQSRRTAQLLLECLNNNEDVDKVTEVLSDATERVLRERRDIELKDQLEAAQRAKAAAEEEARELEAEVKAKKGASK
jgi:hypothetical protein